MRISVIICSHNPRPDYLRRVLDALRVQTMPRDQWELLLIDNASRAPLAAAWDLTWHPHGRHVREDQIGLTMARLRGIREAAAGLLLFVDDDNILKPDFLDQAVLIHEQRPFIGVFGAGCLKPEYEVPPPRELLPYVQLLALREVAAELWSNNPADVSCVPWGAGICATRRTADCYLQIIQEMNVGQTLGRKGAGMACGEDDLFTWAALQTGHAFGIFPSLQITHLISAGRLTQGYFLRLIEGHEFSHGILRYFSTGVRPPRRGLLPQLRILAAGLRHGSFEMRWRIAENRGYRQARSYIEQHGLRPLLNRNAGFPALPGGFLWNSRIADPGLVPAAGNTVVPASGPAAAAGAAPVVSVIIPAYNREQFISRAVESVLNQTFQRAEVIVVDDGSTDRTIEVLAPFVGRIRVIHQDHRGVGAARNAGIRAAKGRWIAFLDTDDWWKPPKLERQMQFIEKYGVKVCFTRSVTDAGELWRDIEEVVSVAKEPGVFWVDDAAASVCQARRHPYLQSMVVEKDLLEKAGMFEETLPNGSDTELIFRLSYYCGFLYLQEPMVVVQIGTENSLSYNQKPESVARRFSSYLRVQAEMYWRLVSENPAKAAISRHRVAYLSLRRAQLACAVGDFRLARALARDVICLAGDLRVRTAGFFVFLFPRLMRKSCRRRFDLA